MKQSIQSLDANLATKDPAADLLWYDLRSLTIEGKGWTDTESFFDRLPARAKGKVRQPVWDLSLHSAGIAARFITDAAAISARWRLRCGALAMPHMPATGVSGLDLYVFHQRRWRWLATGVPTGVPDSAALVASGLDRSPRQFMLYLPLYNGVESIELGVAPDAVVAPAPPRTGKRPIVFYGTSIVQGGCASRPGMAHPAVVGRRLDWPVINLGFSGNGTMDLEMAEFLAEIDAALYVLDCLPNMTAAVIRERGGPFVRILRAARPQTPILMMESVTYQNAYLVKDRAARFTTSNVALREVFEGLVAAGVPGLHYLEGKDLLGHDGEGTVDGTHATDVGYLRMAKALLPVTRRLLAHQP